MNPITDKIKIGTLGELLVQLRLLQYGVQAAQPIKDSGNDLIAVYGREFRAVQVRTSTTRAFRKPDARIQYDVLAVVALAGSGNYIDLEQSRIYLLHESEVTNAARRCDALALYALSEQRVETLFGPLSVR